MKLADYYLGDPRLTLVPIEHLSEAGMSPEFAALLRQRRGWERERLGFFDSAFTLYWTRSARLAQRTRSWPVPRRRNVALLSEPLAVRPYAQILNTSTWLLYESDFDPDLSHPEFAAYLLAYGDRLAAEGEVTGTAVRSAAWWFERSDDECAAFVAAAERSPRPDASAFQALASALDWLRQLRHETLRPPEAPAPHRPIPGTGLLVPRALEQEPLALAARWRDVGNSALSSYRAHWRTRDASALATLLDWLAEDAPPLLVTGREGHTLWDPEQPAELGRLRGELELADGAALREITADLQLIARHTHTFLGAIADPATLPPPAENTAQTGYTYLHAARRLLAYNLHEPGMERLIGPALPYARAMLGGRAWHEWAHLADSASWVSLRVSEEREAELRAAFAERIEDAIAGAPHAVRAAAADDLSALAGKRTPGLALAELLVRRLPDYRTNLVARRFMSTDEAETYVRHNIRTLRPDYAPTQLWRMLIRYLYEVQYLGTALGLSCVPDPHAYFVHSTHFYEDFLASGVMNEERFAELSKDVAQICACYEVDEIRFRFPHSSSSGG